MGCQVGLAWETLGTREEWNEQMRVGRGMGGKMNGLVTATQRIREDRTILR